MNFQVVAYIVVGNIHAHCQFLRVLVLPHPLQCLVIFNLIKFGHSNGYAVPYHYGINLYFLLTALNLSMHGLKGPKILSTPIPPFRRETITTLSLSLPLSPSLSPLSLSHIDAVCFSGEP